MNKFQELGLQESLVNAITDMGFETPSEIQQKAIPLLLSEDTDLVALAQTGTGKTAAFGFPMIQKIDPSSKTTQALILSPTRELCLQITNEIKLYSKYVKGLNTVAIYGGASITEQAGQIKKGAQIIVATPGRMQDMINRKMVNITNIDICVLDEADEMLNMGFYEDITNILSETPKDKNTWLFSATMPKEVAVIAKKFMKKPQEITVGHKNQGSANVSHKYYLVGARDRYPVLKRVADMNPDVFAVIFCRTKRDTQAVAEKLIADGYNAAALHGDLSQSQRDGVMKAFRSRQVQMLVATDVAARGIDVDDITHVINYQLPDEIETYNHRSGRTGRAGKTGESVILITKSEVRKIKQIEKNLQTTIQEATIPTGMEICEVQLIHLAKKVTTAEVSDDIDKYLPSIEKLFEDFTKEELIRKMFAVEFNRFLNYYKKNNTISAPKADGNFDDGSDDSVRFFLNLGEKDGFDWMSLKDFLRDTLELGKDDLFKVDVKEGFSFFNTNAGLSDKVLEVLNNMQYNGRQVNVEVSKNSGRGGGKSGSGKRGGFGKSRGSSRDGGLSSRGGFKGNFLKSSSGKSRKSGGSSEGRAPKNERRSRRSRS